MIHLVLDTNIYAADRRRDSGPLRALMRLCKGGMVKLHVPYVVKNEFLSQQRDRARRLLKDLRGVADELSSITAHATLAKFAESTRNKAHDLRDEAADFVEEEWEHWLKEAGAIQDPINSSHGASVMEDYFSGKPPYKAIKNRNDILDSFLWHAIADLAKAHHPLHVVTGDGTMFKTAKAVSNIIAHEKLADFIDLKECRENLEKLAERAVAKNMRRAGALVPSFESVLKAVVSDKIVDALGGESVTDSSIPDDNNEGMILMVDEPVELDFEFSKVEYYGSSEIGVPFVAVTECELNYAIYKADYYTLDEEKKEQISIDERNEHYYDADESYMIRVFATLQIKLDTEKIRNEKLKKAEIEQLFYDAEYTIKVNDLAVA
jgi:hypothetical protein